MASCTVGNMTLAQRKVGSSLPCPAWQYQQLTPTWRSCRGCSRRRARFAAGPPEPQSDALPSAKAKLAVTDASSCLCIGRHRGPHWQSVAAAGLTIIYRGKKDCECMWWHCAIRHCIVGYAAAGHIYVTIEIGGSGSGARLIRCLKPCRGKLCISPTRHMETLGHDASSLYAVSCKNWLALVI